MQTLRGWIVLASWIPAIVLGSSLAPTGMWKTVDDKTGEVKSLVEIYAAGDGTIEGRVVEVFNSEQGDDPICLECPGERRNQRIEGMVILWGLRPDSEGWSGGRILDPKNGKIYGCRLRLDAEGRLEVRGFLGVSLLGRTQKWERAAPDRREVR